MMKGGQFPSAKGGQFESALTGHLKSAGGGQFHRRVQKGELIIKNPTAISLGMGKKFKRIKVRHLI